MTLETNIVLKDFIGNKTIASNVIKSFNHSNYCGVWLLKGPKGVGKAKLASNIISELFSIENKKNLNELIHPDLFILQHNIKDKKFISVENIRKVSSFLSKTSINSNYRVVLIDSLSEMNLFGYNALLKTIEEYNLDTSFFLIDHMITNVPKTIYSRCKTFTFKNLNNKNMQTLMNATNIIKEEHYSYTILSNGSIGEALRLQKFNALEHHEIYCKFIIGENKLKLVNGLFKKKDANIYNISFSILLRLLSLTLKSINDIKDLNILNQIEERTVALLSKKLACDEVFNLIDNLNKNKQSTIDLNLDYFTSINLFLNELKDNIDKNE